MLQFCLCDDNKRHINSLKKNLLKIIKDNNLAAKIDMVTTSPHDVLKYSNASISRDDVKVYILDIDLKADITGMHVARKIREIDQFAYFIFLTAHQEYTMLSFKLKTFDFLVKPVHYNILESSIVALHKDYHELINRGSSESATISFKSGSNVHLVNIEDIIYFEKYGQILIVHTNKKTIQCYETLKSMEEELEDYAFYRPHKSFLINVDHIKQVDLDNNCVIMSNNARCLVSRTYKNGLIEVLDLRTN